MKSWTKKQLRTWVYSGAMDPMALVGDEIVRGRLDHDIWQDAAPFPWVKARTLEDMVARIFQDEFRRVLYSERLYWRLYDRVRRAVFGPEGALADLAELVAKPKRRVA